MKGITTRPMFGFQCFLINKKFYVGFSNKNNFQVIVGLPKKLQEDAIQFKDIKPFSHGAKMGWLEIDVREARNPFKWIEHGYEYAMSLSKKG